MILENYQTLRLQFRSLSLLDKEPLLAFFNDPQATAYLSIDSEDVNNYANVWIERQLKRYKSIGVGLCAIELRGTGEFVGQCGLVRQFVDGIPKWEVGYHLLPRYWGNGYATEAAMACRDFCFENEMAETLISIVDPLNVRSITVAKRNGMCFWKETIFKDVPVHVYKIRREDWEKLVE
ncbi:MAG: GNAT family N-acetyltransferase [Saprospiraceae bacterium]